MKLVYTLTNGCNSAHADKGLIERSIGKGTRYKLTNNPQCADILIVLGCGVTSYALENTKQIYAKLNEVRKPTSELILSGCASLIDPSISKGIDLSKVIPTKTINKAGGINELVQTRGIIPTFEADGRFNIKPNNGCEDVCSYCAIPFARGKLHSYPIEGIIDEIERHISGRKNMQIGFVGEDIGAYGRDIGTNIIELLHAINLIKGDFKLQVEVINPRWFIEYEELGNVFIEMVQNGRLNPRFGLPIQSASNKILKSMRRKYTIEEYQQIIDKLKDHIKISTDILVGFPGETEEDFRETFEFLVHNSFASPFNFYQVMGFSEIPGTKAARMKDKVSQKEIERRMKIISTLLIHQIANAKGCSVGELTDLPISVNHKNLFGGQNAK